MKRLLSGITPSGDGSLHIGNYLGAVKQFTELAKTHECFLMVADLHALTTIQDKALLQKNTETLILYELALLGDLKNITFFRQSDVPMHAELQSILNNVTPLGLLKRAHAYKDKLARDVMEDDVNVGLFSYPMLMAADILLYKPDLVPVGKDQKQHVEITRDIAGRFNKIFSPVFKLPEPYIPEEVAVVLGTDGKRKMSKSLGNIISIFDDEEIIKKQVMGTYTDPQRIHANDPGHIEGNMVFTYLEFFGERGKTDELKKAYTEGKVSDIEVKNYLYDRLMKTFAPARKVYEELKRNPEKVKKILQDGAEKTHTVASQTMKEVRDATGITNQYSFFQYGLSHSPSDVQGLALISIDEFSRVEMRVGKVVEATYPEKSEKLIRLVVDLGDEKRVIFTGVRTLGYTIDDFLDKQFFFVTNLAPRKMMNEESQGMILAVDGADKPLFLSAEGMPLGAKIR
ncbi:tryptophan--tRNA ligase [Candidatus Gottesmanbacteria bacterium RIFCSPHIGHO2_01_FULL_46_14]|uniref:Tryptophan--tRNA ligase n=1 Tax=Candidatus Gottesmanbacteria bacterium RIFCSPHIGHO2_01_FULL_46_14 TaxID=1798380 RepID=A0A1F5ZJV4_9BACT|nr:MAG: tryptophan--tRNA ligase [Candidatus Gottesmanbacteria bacterium RIFCSPHIGHO2_01_FULL_46_14]